MPSDAQLKKSLKKMEKMIKEAKKQSEAQVATAVGYIQALGPRSSNQDQVYKKAKDLIIQAVKDFKENYVGWLELGKLHRDWAAHIDKEINLDGPDMDEQQLHKKREDRNKYLQESRANFQQCVDYLMATKDDGRGGTTGGLGDPTMMNPKEEEEYRLKVDIKKSAHEGRAWVCEQLELWDEV
eukprot:gene23122-9463_t